MGIGGVGWCGRPTRIPLRQVFRFQIGVGLLERTRSNQSQAFHQPVLCRPETPFDTAFGLGCVGADDIDVELVQGAAEGPVAKSPEDHTKGWADPSFTLC